MHSPLTQYYAAASLDGFLATQDGGIDWLLAFGDVASSYEAFIADVGAIAMGAGTYEWLIRHQVRPDSAHPRPWPYEQPTWVFTHRRLPVPPGVRVSLVSGDVRAVHTAMIATAGRKNVWIAGGGDLAGQFRDGGLLDQIIVQIVPVTLGEGRPFLPRAIQSPPLTLKSVERYGAILAELRYDVPKPAPAG